MKPAASRVRKDLLVACFLPVGGGNLSVRSAGNLFTLRDATTLTLLYPRKQSVQQYKKYYANRNSYQQAPAQLNPPVGSSSLPTTNGSHFRLKRLPPRREAGRAHEESTQQEDEVVIHDLYVCMCVSVWGAKVPLAVG